jgi:pimeloyl-ACP methyl ester carboxylesterase
MRLRALFASFLMFGSTLSFGQQAISTDPPADKANPAVMNAFQMPSHGALLNALVYVAAGAGPHPVVILLHGFPGNEKNLDLAQTIRRAGWDVLYFDYRGSWGSPGDFSFTHSVEDTEAAIAYVRDPVNAKKLRADPGKIVLIGHSMGGFMARYVGSRDAGVEGVGLISAADMGVERVLAVPVGQREQGIPRMAKGLAAEGMAPLAGCTPESLAKEVVAHAEAWNTLKMAPGYAAKSLLVVTSDDGLAKSNDAFVEAVRKAGGTRVTAVHYATDHSYSDRRIALAGAVLQFLAALP